MWKLVEKTSCFSFIIAGWSPLFSIPNFSVSQNTERMRDSVSQLSNMNNKSLNINNKTFSKQKLSQQNYEKDMREC